MRIAIVSTMSGSPWGGSEALWAALAAASLQAGHEVVISVWRWPATPAPVQALQRAGAQVTFRRRPASGRIERILARLRRVQRATPDFVGFQPNVVCLSQGGTYDAFARQFLPYLVRSGAP